MRWPCLRGWLCVLAVATLTGAPASVPLRSVPPDRKLIEWGWDEPSPKFMREHGADMDTYGFDGTIFHAEPLRALF